MTRISIALTIFFGFLAVGASARAQVVVIVNPSVRCTDVSRRDLREVFSGNASSLPDGSQVTPVLLKGGAVNGEFLSAYIGKNEAAFFASWRSLVFSGQASMPKSLDTEAAMVAYVARNRGTIGYIHKTTPHEGVKVLAVR